MSYWRAFWRETRELPGRVLWWVLVFDVLGFSVISGLAFFGKLDVRIQYAIWVFFLLFLALQIFFVGQRAWEDEHSRAEALQTKHDEGVRWRNTGRGLYSFHRVGDHLLHKILKAQDDSQIPQWKKERDTWIRQTAEWLENNISAVAAARMRKGQFLESTTIELDHRELSPERTTLIESIRDKLTVIEDIGREYGY